ncbi:hypothetical protein N7535_005876 [Penicillium sp. DV-2018c]|nr:hypothetical protein N7461_009455 [Penicillium sp. DV-2018c]KAJ5572216.1 hypothetical protein N7535_005876 [Penicillium sp. DV-2018c]
MAHIHPSRVTSFRQARNDLVTLFQQQATFLRIDIDCRSYVIPCLRLQLVQQLDIVADRSRKMAFYSRHSPYVLLHPAGFYETTVPFHCAALKGQCAYLADRLRDNPCTDVPRAVARLIDQIVANLPF